MGKAIDRLKYIHDHAIYLSQEDTEALEEAIDAMNKLEKIELIVTDDYGYLSSYSKVKDIKEVLNENAH